MIWQMKPFIIDFIVVLFFLLMIFIGLIKGFAVRLYDFLATILAVIVAYFLSSPLSYIFVIYQSEGLLEFLGEYINRIILFFIIFVISKIVFALLGRIIKPLFKSLLHHFSLTRFADRILGMVLSALEAIVMIYIALTMVVVPFISDGKKMVKNTIIASRVIELVPYYSDMLSDISNDYMQMDAIFKKASSYDGKDSQTVYMMSQTLQHGYDYHLLTQSQLDEKINDYYLSLDHVTLDQQQYQALIKLLNTGSNQVKKNEILSKIEVGDGHEK